ncbi:MAG: hypothetical protein FWG33_04910, partial [Oscillospiraceae bacterium]|nr:hypothetical protein [Oscillospiraceae bacterium]
LNTVLELSRQLKDRNFENRADSYSKLVEAILKADELFAAGSLEEAQSAYMIALNRSRFTDNAAKRYIERRLTAADGYISVHDLIQLGDILLTLNDYPGAESKYLSARQLASGLNYSDGRKTAMDSLLMLYDLMDKEKAAQDKAANDANAQSQDAQAAQANAVNEALEMEKSGDTALTENDLIGAKLFYTIARERFVSANDSQSIARIDRKIADLNSLTSQNDALSQQASQHVADGDALFDRGNFVEAKSRYIIARNIYSNIQDETSLAIVLLKIEACDRRISIALPLDIYT